MYLELKGKLLAFIIENNPELLFELKGGGSISDYLEIHLNTVLALSEELVVLGKSFEEIEQDLFDAITEEFKPSKFLYIKSILKEDFPDEFKRLVKDNLMAYTVIRLVALLSDTFEAFCFSTETINSPHLRHAVIAQLHNSSIG